MRGVTARDYDGARGRLQDPLRRVGSSEWLWLDVMPICPRAGAARMKRRAFCNRPSTPSRCRGVARRTLCSLLPSLVHEEADRTFAGLREQIAVRFERLEVGLTDVGGLAQLGELDVELAEPLLTTFEIVGQ